MFQGEQQMPPVWEAFGVLEDCAIELSTEPPLPPYVILHGLLDEPIAFFDSLDAAFAFFEETTALGFIGDILTVTTCLTAAQKGDAREALR